MNITIRTHRPHSSTAPTPGEIRQAFEGAIKEGIAPEAVSEGSRQKPVSLYLSASHRAMIASASYLYPEWTTSNLIGGLAHAYWRKHSTRAKPAKYDATRKPSPMADDRDSAQNAMVSEVMDCVRRDLIALVEGGTGIGKSRVIGRCAVEAAKQGRRVLVVAPTFEALLHLHSEFRLTPDSDESLQSILLPGKGNFIDGDRVRDRLNELDYDPAKQLEVEDWITAGGKPISETGKRIEKALPGISYLMEDFLHHCPDITKESVQMDEYSDETQWGSVISDLRTKALNPKTKILFATHAMLAAEIRSQIVYDNSILGKWDLLLADEAHDLEDSFASSLTSIVSLQSALRLFSNSKLWTPHNLGKAAERIATWLSPTIRKLQEISKDSPRDVRIDPSFFEVDENLFSPFFSKKKKSSFDPNMAEARRVLSAFSNAKKAQYPAYLNPSPVRRYPRLTVGPNSVTRYLQAVWNQTSAAGLFSATLHLPDSRGNLSPDYILGKLGISARFNPARENFESQEKRLKKPYLILNPSWIKKTPTVHLPNKDFAPLFPAQSRYKDDSEGYSDALSDWRIDIARFIAENIATQAKGGILCLCNSYDDIASWQTNLPGLGVDSSRIIAMERGVAFTRFRAKFELLSRQNTRPILLAVGPSAWTGLDLRDTHAKEPSEDNLLTDLVVPRLPFNSISSSVHNSRKRRHGPSPDDYETLLRLRQGLGRLVRRPGLKDRHIWFLDGRIIHRKRMGSFLRLLDSYPNRLPLLPLGQNT